MPYNGSGTFNLSVSFVPDTSARSEDVNTVLQDIAAGLTNALTRDGQGAATSDVVIGGYRIRQVARGTDAADAVNLSQLQSFLPSGTPIPWLTGAVPSGFLLAFGQVLNQTDQPGIFGAFGTSFNTGGETASQFRMPDLRGCVLAGLDNMGGTARNVLTNLGLSGTKVGAFGGEQAHALTAAENGPHAHGVTDPAHGHGINDPTHVHGNVKSNNSNQPVSGTGSSANNGVFATNTDPASTGISIVAAQTGISIQSSGSGTGHNNVQPTMLCNWIIKT